MYILSIYDVLIRYPLEDIKRHGEYRTAEEGRAVYASCFSGGGGGTRRGGDTRGRGCRGWRPHHCASTQPHGDARRRYGTRRDAGDNVGCQSTRWQISHRLHALRHRRALYHVCRCFGLGAGAARGVWCCRREARFPRLRSKGSASEVRGGEWRSGGGVPNAYDRVLQIETLK